MLSRVHAANSATDAADYIQAILLETGVPAADRDNHPFLGVSLELLLVLFEILIVARERSVQLNLISSHSCPFGDCAGWAPEAQRRRLTVKKGLG